MIIAMDQAIILAGIILFGLAIGSFNGATVWRLRARQLQEDKEAGEKIDKTEYEHLKKLIGRSVNDDRSMCLYCHHQLRWYDLLPLVSWITLRGKCRYCHKPIGRMEPLIELGTAAFFVISYLAWPTPLTTGLDMLGFGLWIVVGVGLIILLAYDARWFLLPDRIVFPLLGLSAIAAVLRVVESADKISVVISLLAGCMILSGLYYVLYIISQGRWIGFGDIKLGLILALMLGEWQLAFLTLFLANIIGCLIVLPGLLAKKLKRTSHVPFGPMLIVAYFIVGIFGQAILLWYASSFSL